MEKAMAWRTLVGRLVAILLFLGMSFAGAEAQELPRLKQNMPYDEARKMMIDAGWQAAQIRVQELEDDTQQYLISSRFHKKGYMEFNNCMPTGLGLCSAIFSNDDGKKFYISIDEGDQVANWGYQTEALEDSFHEPIEGDEAAPDLGPTDFRLLVVNSRSNTIHLKLFSDQRKWAWPDGNQIFFVRKGETNTFSITCRPQEKICYGAAIPLKRGGYGTSWGASITGNQRCSNCCFICGTPNNGIRLR
jgi:hypothetical protein